MFLKYSPSMYYTWLALFMAFHIHNEIWPGAWDKGQALQNHPAAVCPDNSLSSSQRK